MEIAVRDFAKTSSVEHKLVFQETALKCGLRQGIVEKDFWVCYTLDFLFHRCKFERP